MDCGRRGRSTPGRPVRALGGRDYWRNPAGARRSSGACRARPPCARAVPGRRGSRRAGPRPVSMARRHGAGPSRTRSAAAPLASAVASPRPPLRRRVVADARLRRRRRSHAGHAAGVVRPSIRTLRPRAREARPGTAPRRRAPRRERRSADRPLRRPPRVPTRPGSASLPPQRQAAPILRGCTAVSGGAPRRRCRGSRAEPPQPRIGRRSPMWRRAMERQRRRPPRPTAEQAPATPTVGAAGAVPGQLLTASSGTR